MALTASAADSRFTVDQSSANASASSTRPKTSAPSGLTSPCGERPVRGAAHHLVAVALDPAVDGVGAAGRERAAEEHRDDQPERRHLAGGQDHGRERW